MASNHVAPLHSQSAARATLDKPTIMQALTHVIQQRKDPSADPENGSGLRFPGSGDSVERKAAERAIREALVHSPATMSPLSQVTSHPAAHTPVQRILRVLPMRWLQRGTGVGFLDRLNNIARKHPKGQPSQQAASEWGEEVDVLEHDIYAWFRENSQATDADRKSIAHLMDAVQVEHHRYTRFVMECGFFPYMRDIDSSAEAIWATLRENKGIMVSDTGQNGVKTEADFRILVHSMNARLISRPGGRNLLRSLLAKTDENPQVTVKQFDPALLKEVAKAMAEDGTPDFHEDALVSPEGQADPNAGYATTDRGGKIAKGIPSRSVMYLEPGYQDSTAGRENLGNQRPQRPQDPVTPAFITYSHELIHALHNKHGLNLSKTKAGQKSEENETVGLSDPESPADVIFLLSELPEAYVTENLLRDEHGIPRRTSY